MKRLLFLFALLVSFGALADTNSVPPMIQIPWVIDPVNSTNYSRTNTPYWWDNGTNYDTGVKMWQMTQAIMENLRRLTNALSTTLTPTNIEFASPRWQDAVFSGMSFGFGATVPARATIIGGISSRTWDANDEGDFSIQWPHGLSSTNAALPDFYYEPHIHISASTIAAGTSNSIFTLVHQAGYPTGDFGTPITNTATQVISTTNTHYMLSFGNITNNALAAKDSVIVRGTLYCDSTGDGTIAETIVDSLDFHVPLSTVGSAAIHGD